MNYSWIATSSCNTAWQRMSHFVVAKTIASEVLRQAQDERIRPLALHIRRSFSEGRK